MEDGAAMMMNIHNVKDEIVRQPQWESMLSDDLMRAD